MAGPYSQAKNHTSRTISSAPSCAQSPPLEATSLPRPRSSTINPQSANRTASWHISSGHPTPSSDASLTQHHLRRASTISYVPKIDIIASTNKQALRLSGEHNISARHKARTKLRRSSSAASQRRRCPAVSNETATVVSELDINSATHILSAADLKRVATQRRLSQALPVIPASPITPTPFQPWHSSRNGEAEGVVPHRADLLNFLAPSRPPPSCHKRPALLSSVSPKSSPVVRQQELSARRKLHDVSHFPASAKWYFWHLYIDDRAPFVLTSLQVHRRPSKKPAQEAESSKRKFNRRSGFWSWHENV